MKRLVRKIFVALARYLEVDFVVIRQVAGGGGQDSQFVLDNPIPLDKNVGLLAVFGGGFSAGGPGAFAGSTLGTLLALNALPATFGGNVVDAQIAGVSVFGVQPDGGVQPGQGAALAKTGNRLYVTVGVPPAALGQNGDFAFNQGGTEAGHTLLYHKESGSWVATAA